MRTITKSFPDLAKEFAWMVLQEEIEKTLALWPRNLLASLYLNRLHAKESVKKVCRELLEAHRDNPQAIISMLGEDLINKINRQIYG